MLDHYRNPTKDTMANFLSKTTGMSYHSAYMDLVTLKVGKKSESYMPKFDYSSLIGKYSGFPKKSEVTGFMMKETGCSYETAHMKLNMPGPAGSVKKIGGVKLYPVSMIRCI